MKLSVENRKKGVLQSTEGTDHIHLVYEPVYKKGDFIRIETDAPGFFCIRLEDTLPVTTVWMNEKEAEFPIPFGVDRAGFSPRSFTGKRHFIEVYKAGSKLTSECRNLAYNPHDQAGNKGICPHMRTNVEYADTLRNRIFPDRGLFAARNVIDGILANESHRLYPHQSWGINRNPDAWLTCEFGRSVDIETIRLALRCEFPHDNYWVSAMIRCSDGSEEIIALRKTAELQSFPLKRIGINSLTLCSLIMSEEPSPFPALSLLEIYGTEHSKKEI